VRQVRELLALGRQGELMRAIALARDHLAEYPSDDAVRNAVAGWVARANEESLISEAADLLQPRRR
jgi:hypothetical protein